MVLDGDVPEFRRARAPMISVAPRFAAVILMLTGRRCRRSSPNLVRSAVPARHDWHPVSAITG